MGYTIRHMRDHYYKDYMLHLYAEPKTKRSWRMEEHFLGPSSSILCQVKNKPERPDWTVFVRLGLVSRTFCLPLTAACDTSILV